MGLLLLPIDLKLSLALFLFLDTDRFLALPFFDDLDLFDSSFFSSPLFFFNFPLLLFLYKHIMTSFFNSLFVVLTLNQFLVFLPSDSFLFDSRLLDGLSLDALPLLFLLSNSLLTSTCLCVLDVLDANPFFFHLPYFFFVLMALANDSRLVELSAPLLFFLLFIVLFYCLVAVFGLGTIVVVLQVLPPGLPLEVPFVVLILLIVRLILILFLLFVLIFLTLFGGVNDWLAFTLSFLLLAHITTHLNCTIISGIACVGIFHITTYFRFLYELRLRICDRISGWLGNSGISLLVSRRNTVTISVVLSELNVVKDGLFFKSSARLSEVVGMSKTSGRNESGHKAIEFHFEVLESR